MKKIILAFIFIASSAFSQVWLSQLGDMMRSIYDTNNDGIVDVAYTSVTGPESALYAVLAGTASNAIYATMSFSNSNSIYAEGAGNSVLFDSLPSSYYTNLSNMIGYIATNQVTNLAEFIQLFAPGLQYVPFYTIGNVRISNNQIFHTNSGAGGTLTLGDYPSDSGSIVIGQGGVVIESGNVTYIGTNGVGPVAIGPNAFGAYKNFYATGAFSKIGGLEIDIGIETAATNNVIRIGHSNDSGIILNQYVSISNNVISNLAYPTFSNQPATKSYVDSAIFDSNNLTNYLHLAGGTMRGEINADGNILTNVSKIFPYNNEIKLGSYDSSVGGIRIQNGIIYIDSGTQISIGTLSANTNGILIGAAHSTGIAIARDPTASNHIANKWYVDNTKSANLTYTLQGSLVAGSNQILVHVPYDLYFGTNMGVAVFDAPTGADIKIDVMLTNTSILTSSNISITTNTKTAYQTLTATQASRFDELSIHIVQVGSTIAGGYLTISIPVRRRD